MDSFVKVIIIILIHQGRCHFADNSSPFDNPIRNYAFFGFIFSEIDINGIDLFRKLDCDLREFKFSMNLSNEAVALHLIEWPISQF